jgi:hypothetical protein
MWPSRNHGVYVVKLIHLHPENTSLHYHAASKEEPNLLQKLMEGSAFDKEIYYWEILGWEKRTFVWAYIHTMSISITKCMT